MRIDFTKAQASGNDFIILDDRTGRYGKEDLDPSRVSMQLCRRKLSVGADGLLVLEASEQASVRMRMINPDGSEVTMCGNGARCTALYASSAGAGDDLTIETGAGVIEARVRGKDVRLKMTDPVDVRMGLNVGLGSNLMIIHHINTGVPHVVHLVENIGDYDVKRVGRQLREHSMFSPDGANVDFVGDIKGNTASVRTYERGVEDETLACGTGITASGVALGLLDMASSPVRLKTRNGDVQTVYFRREKDKVTDVYLEGRADIIYKGQLELS